MEVSDTQLLEDIYFTRKEVNAYNNLRIGYQILSELPENQGTQAKKYSMEYNYYNSLYEDCLAFLNRLNEIKEERGIEMVEE